MYNNSRYYVILSAALEKGQIPDFYRLENQIIDDDHAYAKQATAFIRKIIDKLPKKHIKTEDINIFISGNTAINAMNINRGKPMLIVTKGLLETAKTEDELAGVIVHELMHLDLGCDFPEHHNSKIEETMCDLASIEALDQAGYRRDGLITMSQRLPDNGQKHPLQILYDPHPNWDIRIKNLSNQLAAYEKEHGLQGEHQHTPLEGFIEDYRNVQFPFYIDQYLEEKNYKNAPTAKKMAILGELLSDSARYIQHYEKPLFNVRLQKLKSEVDLLKINLKNPDEQEAFARFIDTILKVDRDFLWAAYQAAGYKKLSPAVGLLGQFQKCCLDFVNCTEKERGMELAKEIMDLLEKGQGIIDWHSVNHWFHMEFFRCPPAVKPSKYGLFKSVDPELPWNRHLGWAKDSEKVCEVLETLGVLSTVRYSYPPEERAALGFDLNKTINNRNVIDHLPGGSGYDSVLKNGKVVYKEPEKYVQPVFLSRQAEQTRLNKKDDLAKTVVVDWPLLESNPAKFCKTYKDHLEHVVTYLDGGFAFAERIMEKISEIALRDQEKADEIFTSILRNFSFNSDRYNSMVPEAQYYKLGISTRHPFIQHAFKDLEKFERYIPNTSSKLFYYQTKELVLGTPPPPPHSYSKSATRELSKAKHQILKQYQRLTTAIPLLEERWNFHEYEVIFDLRRSRINENLSSNPELLNSKKWIKRAYHIDNLLKIKANYYPEIWAFEAHRIFKNNPYLDLSLDEFAYLLGTRETIAVLTHTLYGPPSELSDLYTEHLKKYEKKFFAEALKSTNPDFLIKCYHFFHLQGKTFDDYNSIKTFEAHIRTVYDSLESLEEKKHLLDNLLLTQRIEFDPKFGISSMATNFSFTDVSFKHWVIAEYSKVLSESWGKDGGKDLLQPATADEESWASLRRHEDQLPINPIYGHIDTIIRKAPLSVSIPVLQAVANHIEAQKPLSFFIRDRIDRATQDNILKQGASFGAFGEILLTEIPRSRDKSLRTDTILFLLNSEDNFDLDDYAKKMSRGTQALIRPVQKWAHDSTSLVDEYKNNKSYILERLRTTRDLFKDLNFQQQILVIDQFLFPAENPVSLAEGKKLVLDALFNPDGVSEVGLLLANALTGKTVDAFREDADESRQIVESYLEALEEVAKDPHYKSSIEAREKLILSAMLIANSKSKHTPGSSSGRGEALNQVLTAMGPAGRKLAQAIESHTETPDDIKYALRHSKTNAAPPTRWEVHEWADLYYQPVAAAGAESPDGIKQMGKMLGAGSYGVTIQAYKTSGDETAITFLRPHMQEQARDEFMILDTAARILIEKNPAFRPFDDMQREAAIASGKEVDMTIASQQQKFAKQLYDGLEIVVNNHKFKFGVAEWIGHGKQYKETKVVLGEHFNDLEQSKDLKHLKKEAAAAILAAELYNLLKGGYIDNDRHGGQQKLVRISTNETYIGNFDFGGMSLLPQTSWQKKLLGQLIGEAMWQISKPLGAQTLDGNLLTNLTEKYIREYEKKNFTGADGKHYLIGQDKAKHFVGQVKRGLLALGNYMSHLDKDPKMLRTIITAVLATGQIDETIEAGMREKLGIFSGKLDELKKANQASEISIIHRGP